jgi:hypothetical protein
VKRESANPPVILYKTINLKLAIKCFINFNMKRHGSIKSLSDAERDLGSDFGITSRYPVIFIWSLDTFVVFKMHIHYPHVDDFVFCQI